ncbi:UvrD-helicase domain-containing protein [Flavobacterium notoginsengisoli]|uniref:UvrD-helicase domain-containing protein n=1 Tax=Flavobacterium notoginsengisoli TaxID=1478199 RepID=UPI0036329F8E
MVERRVNLEIEIQKIFEIIDAGQNFLLSGGAGSGKTYSLVQVIRQVIEEHPFAKIACMTFTNVAVKEIEHRVNHKSLNVTTIHDFLWDNIKNFQTELKLAIIDLSNDVSQTKIILENPTFQQFEEDGIQYKEYVRLREGIISHDELLIIAEYMFSKYSRLVDIVKDRFKFIFIDEYQDTNQNVVKIFLEHFNKSRKKTIIGFFGDSMQSIYDDGIGNLIPYLSKKENQLIEVKKEQNRRSPRLIYELANKLRTDGLIQVHSNDPSAPNMISPIEVKNGSIKFFYSKHDDLQKVKDYLKWDFENLSTDIIKTKELNLTHNLISKKAGFEGLMEIYNRDRIIDYKNIILKEIKENPQFVINDDDTFGDVIEKVNKKRTPQIQEFIDKNQELFNDAKKYPFNLFKGIYLSSDVLTDDKKQDYDDDNSKGSKRDSLLKHLFKIQNCIRLYQENEYNEFIMKVQFKIRSLSDKKTLRDKIECLINVEDKTIEDIITEADELKLVLKDDRLDNFIEKNEYVYNRVKKIFYSEFVSLYKYLEGFTPFSTQHKTKGSEFNNVLVVLDNGNWNQYNFDYLFNNRTDKSSVLERTQKIFYVCATRAKDNLAVFYNIPSNSTIDKAVEWFGEENVINIDDV